MAGILDEVEALEFDQVCTLRLVIYDNECRKAQAKLIAIEVGKMFSGDNTGLD